MSRHGCVHRGQLALQGPDHPPAGSQPTPALEGDQHACTSLDHVHRHVVRQHRHDVADDAGSASTIAATRTRCERISAGRAGTAVSRGPSLLVPASRRRREPTRRPTLRKAFAQRVDHRAVAGVLEAITSADAVTPDHVRLVLDGPGAQERLPVCTRLGPVGDDDEAVGVGGAHPRTRRRSGGRSRRRG